MIWVELEALAPAVVGMEGDVEGVWRWRCVSLPAELEGVVWREDLRTVEVAACGTSAR